MLSILERGSLVAKRGRGRLVTRRLSEQRRLLLNVGDRGAYLDGWINLDISPARGDGYLDAAKRWPLADRCARAIRSEHMIEHLTWDQAKVCVGEMFRVLDYGGVCRICTPDLEGITRLYLAGNPQVIAAHREHGYFAPTAAHMPNNYLRMWGHQFIHDYHSLSSLLAEAGFSQIDRQLFGSSRHDVLSGTDTHDLSPLAEIGLFIDAVKMTS